MNGGGDDKCKGKAGKGVLTGLHGAKQTKYYTPHEHVYSGASNKTIWQIRAYTPVKSVDSSQILPKWCAKLFFFDLQAAKNARHSTTNNATRYWWFVKRGAE